MAKVPNADRAIIDPRKITHYLLSLSHPVGSAKARFLLRFGFRQDRPQRLTEALRRHIMDHAISETDATPHGVIHAVDGALPTPDGRAPCVRTVWIIKAGENIPRFVTLVPA